MSKEQAEKWAEGFLNSEEGKRQVQERISKVLVLRGCPNKQCFCTGRCEEVIGYRDKLPHEN